MDAITSRHRPRTAARCGLLAALVGLLPGGVPPIGAQTLDDARALYMEGRFAEALELFQEVARSAGDDPESGVAAHYNACYLLIFEFPDYEQALEHCERALELRRQLDDEERLPRTLNLLGLVLQYQGRYREAEARFLEALEIYESFDDAEGEVINRSNLGRLATEAGRYTSAMRYLNEALEIARRHAGEPWVPERTLIIRVNYGAALEKVGAYLEALSVYEDLLAGNGGTGEPKDGGRTVAIPRAALQVNRGVMYRNLGDPVRALAAFEQAAETYGAVGDLAGLSNAWLNQGLALHLNLDRPRAAEEAYRRAFAFARESGDRAEEAKIQFYLGRLLLEQGRLDEAEEAFATCLEIATAGGSAEGRWSGFEGLGRIAEKRGDLRAAFDYLSRAIEEIERVRAELGRSRRAGYFGDKRAVYAAAVRVLAELGERQPEGDHVERAFELVQRAKARELLDVLGDEAGRAEPLSAAALRERLGDGELLELFVGERRLFAWSISGGALRMVDLGPASPILERVAGAHRALAAGEEPAAADLRALSAALLGEPGISSGSSPLWIAADGRLDYLPFELLEIDGMALVDRRPVSYLPSASTLAWLRREDTAAAPALGLAGLGDPSLARRDAGLEGAGLSTPAELLVDRFRLMPLPAAAGELEAIGRQLPGDHVIRLGTEATEEALRRLASQGSRVIHLATHSVVDERPGRGAAILLTADGADDGLLQPEEIAALDVRTRLTVLASCSSALGPSESGRALASLTGAFLAAGSPAVVATLWDVDDGATAAFMEQFYFQLSEGRPPAEALRRTKERLRADRLWNRPSLWAGYVLIGDAPPVVVCGGRGWTLAVAAVVLVAVLGLGYRWRSRRDRG